VHIMGEDIARANFMLDVVGRIAELRTMIFD